MCAEEDFSSASKVRGRTSWTPILKGSLADSARRVIEDIAQGVLQGVPPSPPDEASSAPAADRLALASGKAGQAIFFAYLSLDSGSQTRREEASTLLEEAIDGVAEEVMDASLYSGFPGIAWVVEHLKTHLLDLQGGDPCEAIDEALLAHLKPPSWSGEFDLINGLTGLGFYALERRAQPLALKCLKRVLHHLEGTARPESGGFTWYTSPRYLPPAYRMKGPDGYSNLGVAHGVPGVISFLGSACACLEPSALPQARPLLEGGVAWLLKQKLAGASDAVFPFFTGPEVEPVPARTAWCYGDPGIAAALLHAALSAKEPSWKEEALGIARAAAERAPEKTGVLDAGLCHGAAGLAHLFNRMYQSTGETFLRNTAEYWFHRTLELRQPSEGIGGYRTWLAGESRWIFDPGFLTGSAGIGLVLLAAVSEVPPGWDRVLGLSGPPDWRSAAG